MSTATANKSSALTAVSRDRAGKGAARAIRREGGVPAVLYSKGNDPVHISLKANELRLEYMRGRFRSRLVEIKIDDKQTVKALPKDLQFHPVTDIIEHVDFIRVEPGVALRVMIPVKFTNQEKSPGLKRGGVLNVVRHEIEFTCPPESIPVFIEANLTGLDIGASIHIEDIKLPSGIEPVIKRNFTIAAVAGRKAEEEEVKPVATTAEGAPAEGAAAEGAAAGAAAPAAGAAPAADAKKDEGKKDAGKK